MKVNTQSSNNSKLQSSGGKKLGANSHLPSSILNSNVLKISKDQVHFMYNLQKDTINLSMTSNVRAKKQMAVSGIKSIKIT